VSETQQRARRRPLSRRRFLTEAASALVVAATWLPARPGLASPGARDALVRAHAWLWRAQAQDGRFASATYGLLASGQSLTPFVLESLLQAPPPLVAAHRPDMARALDAALALCDERGALGFSGPVADYPCYATGLLLSCIGALKPEGWRDLAAPSIAWLRGQQLRAGDGWRGHPAQGGWGMGTRQPLAPPHAGHVDLSMTARVVAGLRAVGVPADDPALLEVRDFVARCQTQDGSFVYSPVELALNKGLRDGAGRPLGYGSATTDGLQCLHALAQQETEPAQRAAAWLRAHHRVDRNPGLEGGPMEPFAEAMRGYYRAGAARCLQRFGGPPGWQAQLARAIAAEQRSDGHLQSESPLQKEDDPLVATAFAAQALACCLEAGRDSL